MRGLGGFGSNMILDGIQAYALMDEILNRPRQRALQEEDRRLAMRERTLDLQKANLEMQDWQDARKARDIGGVQAAIETDTATPEQLAQAEKITGLGSTPIKSSGSVMPEKPAAKVKTSDLMPKSINEMRKWQQERGQQEMTYLQSALKKMEAAEQGGTAPDLSTEEAAVITREVVNNPAFLDSNLGLQMQAITRVERYLKQAKAVQTPTKITDPQILKDVMIAHPNLVLGSNLKDARVSALFVEPGQNGESRILVGISGANEKGEPVDGMLTYGRSSDPNDEIRVLSSGEMLTQTQWKKRIANGLLAARAKLGDKAAIDLYQKAQANKATAQMIMNAAGQTEDPQAREKLTTMAGLIASGYMGTDDARQIVAEVYKSDPEAMTLLKNQLSAEREAMREDRRDARAREEGDRRERIADKRLDAIASRVEVTDRKRERNEEIKDVRAALKDAQKRLKDARDLADETYAEWSKAMDPDKPMQLRLNKRAHADIKATEAEVKDLEAQLAKLNGGKQGLGQTRQLQQRQETKQQTVRPKTADEYLRAKGILN